jgi:hypothetical protein
MISRNNQALIEHVSFAPRGVYFPRYDEGKYSTGNFI